VVAESPRERWSCPRCERMNMPSLQLTHWSLHPRIEAMEFSWNLALVVFALLSATSILLFSDLTSEVWGVAISVGLSLLLFSAPLFLLVLGMRRRQPSWAMLVIAAVAMFWATRWMLGFQDFPVIWFVVGSWLGLAALTIFLSSFPGSGLRAWLMNRTAGVLPTRDELRAGRLPVARYCLYCFGQDVRDVEGGGLSCSGCGRVSRRVDRRNFWNLNPTIATIEFLLKGGIVLGAMGFGWWLLGGGANHSVGLTSQGWFLAFGPMALASLLWLTIGKLRQHLYSFSPAIVWGIVALPTLLGLPLVLLISRRFGRWKAGRMRGGSAAAT
jgi:hypothetical protein